VTGPEPIRPLEELRDLLRRQLYRKAKRRAKRLLRADAGQPCFWLALSEAELHLGHRRRAIRAARRAVALEPETMRHRLWLIDVLLSSSRASLAREAIAEALALDPECVALHERRARIFAAARRLAEAEAAAREGLRIDPDDADCRDALEEILLSTGGLKRLDREVRGRLREDPEDPRGHARLGQIALAEGRQRDAAAHYREALRLDPMDEEARTGLLKAIRARNLLYRWALRASFGWAALVPRTRCALLFALFGAALALFRDLGTVAALSFWGFLLLPSLGTAAVDLLLRFTREGRRVLRLKRILEIDCVLSMGALLGALRLPPLLSVPSIGALGVLLPLLRAFRWPPLHGRRRVIAAALAPAALLPAGGLLSLARGTLGSIVLVAAICASFFSHMVAIRVADGEGL